MPERTAEEGRPAPAEPRRPTVRRWAMVGAGLMILVVYPGVCFLVVCAGIYFGVISGQDNGDAASAVSNLPGMAGPGPERDRQLGQMAVGTWRDFYQGKRTMTLRPDGTCTMVIELTGWRALSFTSRLELDIAWSIDDGKMHRRTLGGRPPDKVEFVNKLAGVEIADTILDLTADRMILLDQNGYREYSWQRVD